jgi:hypothetical protein
MTLSYLAATVFGGAGVYCLGKARGFKEGVQRVFHDLEATGTCHGLDHVAVGYVYSEDAFNKRPVQATTDVATEVTTDVQTGSMSGRTECELAFVPADAYQGNLHQGNLQHAAEVAIVGVHRATYEHPFLSPVNAG